LEFYKVKTELLQEQLALAKEENEKFTKECENLRTLNFEYVKQLNVIEWMIIGRDIAMIFDEYLWDGFELGNISIEVTCCGEDHYHT